MRIAKIRRARPARTQPAMIPPVAAPLSPPLLLAEELDAVALAALADVSVAVRVCTPLELVVGSAVLDEDVVLEVV